MLQEAFNSAELFGTTLKLSESVRPQDCVTASHLLKFFIHTLTFKDIVTLTKSSGKRSNHLSDLFFNGMLNAIDDIDKDDDGMKNDKCFVIVSWLLARLKHHEGIARSNLLLASATSPMYPVIHCIAKVMATVDWKKVGGSCRWKKLVQELIDTCIDVANVVSVVVNDSSPEGNVPDDLATNCDLDVQVDFTDAQPFLKDDYESGEEGEELSGEDELGKSQKAESKVRLMPEFLVVCSWRSIKETSLILGQISSSVPISSDDDDDSGNDLGLLSKDMIHKIGNFFRDQLLQSRHRGAFELAYAGFVQLVRTMWSCSVSKLQTLPQVWVKQLMERVKGHDADDLCSTRRSAGVPFFFLAVVSTEPAINGRRSLKFVMKNLIGIASEPITSENTNHVHSRNILRVLFRDSSLGDQVQPFISDGIKVCIEGYNCSYWPVSNSSALLFSILLRRIFGIRKPKAGSQARNLGMSGRAFFTRHPELFEYFLEQLLSLNYDGVVSSIRRGTFLILITLSNLAPSAGENSKSNINIDKLIPHILKCSASKDIKIREMAAKALSSLVSKEQTIKVILEILSGLSKHNELRMCDQNYIHGSCLQIQHLMDSTDFYNLLSNDANGKASLVELVWGLRALFSDKNPCLVTRYSFGMIIERLLFMPFQHNAESFQSQVDDLAQILKQNLQQLLKETSSDNLNHFEKLSIDDMESSTHPACHSSAQSCHPFFNQYSCFVVRSSLRHLLLGGNNNVPQFEDLIEVLLNSSSGDVHLEILKLLKSLTASCNEHISVQNEVGISDDVEDGYEDETYIPEFKVHEWTPSSDREASILEPFLTEKIVKMVIQFVAKDVFHLNLIQALQCLIEMMKLSSAGLSKVLTFDQITHLFDISTKLSLESHFIAVQEKALCLASHCCYRLFDSRFSDHGIINGKHVDLLKQFCSSVNLRALSEHSNTNLKLASSFSLTLNYDSLLVDSTGRLGCLVYKNWTSLMQLVQEEDLRVRQMSVSCIPHFQHILSLNHATDLNPTYGSKVLLEIFFQLHCYKKDSSWSVRGLQVLSDWLMLDPIERQNCQDVRLFDKGELNPYIDEVREILTIHKTLDHLINQVHSSNKIYLTNSTGIPHEGRRCSLECPSVGSERECQICKEAKKWIDSNRLTSWLNKLKRDKGSLENQLRETNTIEVFTRQSTVQRLIINYLKVTLTANLIMKFTGVEEQGGTSEEFKFSNVENIFNHVKYLMS